MRGSGFRVAIGFQTPTDKGLQTALDIRVETSSDGTSGARHRGRKCWPTAESKGCHRDVIELLHPWKPASVRHGR